MSSWRNSNENILRLRVTETRYAEDFIEYGRIKFSTPQSWVDYAKKNGNGRGDFYEGTLAFCHKYDIKRIIELNSKYDSPVKLINSTRDLLRVFYNNRLLYKDKRSMKLPCYCLYILKIDAFACPESAGKQKMVTRIDGSYFRDFVDNQTKEQVNRKPKDEQPALIVIFDFDVFINRLIKALKSIGVDEKDILMHYPYYIDFESKGEIGWLDFQQEYPKELFVKNKRFEKQSEGRVVIKTRDPKVLERLHKTIDLGCMADIAKVIIGYYPEGTNIELDALVCEEKAS